MHADEPDSGVDSRVGGSFRPTKSSTFEAGISEPPSASSDVVGRSSSSSSEKFRDL